MRVIRISLALLGLVTLVGATTPDTGGFGDTGDPGSTGDTGSTGGTGAARTPTGDTGTSSTTGDPADTGEVAPISDDGTGSASTDGVGTPAPPDTGPVSLASGLARERGGVSCATGAAPRLPWGLLGIAALLTRSRRLLGAVLLAIAAPVCEAWAGPPEPEEEPRSEVHLILRGVAERWNDPSITTVYRSGTWLAGAGLVIDVLGPLGVDVEVGFGRLKGDRSTLEVAPLSALVELTAPLGRADGFLAAGPAWTVFTESGGGEVVDGARTAAELRGGFRVDTGLIQPPAAPAPSTFDRMEFELYFARRAELPGPGRGLQLGAWRASVGLGVVF